MAAMKVIQCREHGGSFEIESRRGRPPVRCTDENPCDMVKAKRRRSAQASGKLIGERLHAAEALEAQLASAEQAQETKLAVKKTRSRSTLPKKAGLRTSNWCTCDEQGGERHERGIEGCKYATRGAAVVVRHNPSVVLGKRAKDQLEPLGWNLKGRGWIDEDASAWAEITGNRGEESIVIRFKDGKIESQNYSLWDADKSPGQNGRPKARLLFDPDECSDTDLARELSGRKVTWWNRIAENTEVAIIGDKLKIEHTFTGGNETARQIHFIDATPQHGRFRAFNVDALMRVK